MLFMPSTLRQLPLGKRLPNRVLIVSALMTSLTLTACSPSNSETQGVNSDSVEQFKNDLLSVLTPEASTETQTEIEAPAEPVKQLQPNVSQQFIGTTDSQQRLAKALPELPYDITDLPPKAQEVNQAMWTPEAPLDENLILKIQALLTYNHHSVGAVDGRFGENVVKALQVFQEKNGLQVTGDIDSETWNKLTEDSTINEQPVLVNYTLTDEDVTLISNPKGQQFESVLEAVAEKFHMSQGLLLRLNADTSFEAGNTIVVYNPYQPNAIPVHRVVAVKSKNLLYAYDENDTLVASYPTTMGSVYKPSPNGEYKVLSRIKDPTYNKDFKNPKTALPPGPNNPVGRVWIGINKRSYGIHGSPNPERISRQNSSGCVRLTNWDALGLYGTIEEGAKVEFL
ncbi:L,D-transpeptidase family protein [Psychrobacter sanguinis]|uniref:L,D-transpeptidase family protein n=2 Tax=Psychrobacter sanguinis TaxID=861445 RepID=UPI001D13529E|nr:L,D-transpeptidase family protein [Psychrobacter sanguinis]UEC26551.1 L,D-transpeptidase family protein [Psychrobacter sanguinis]